MSNPSTDAAAEHAAPAPRPGVWLVATPDGELLEVNITSVSPSGLYVKWESFSQAITWDPVGQLPFTCVEFIAALPQPPTRQIQNITWPTLPDHRPDVGMWVGNPPSEASYGHHMLEADACKFFQAPLGEPHGTTPTTTTDSRLFP